MTKWLASPISTYRFAEALLSFANTARPSVGEFTSSHSAVTISVGATILAGSYSGLPTLQ